MVEELPMPFQQDADLFGRQQVSKSLQRRSGNL
jgi:hypothetical protein